MYSDYNFFELNKKKIENLKDRIDQEDIKKLTVREKREKIEEDINFLRKYYEDQRQICLRSSLYGENICENASKVLMLFSEIYPVLVDFYGIGINPDIIISFENSHIYRKWFDRVKFILGSEIRTDPDFIHIHKWLGKGLFLKTTLSIIYYSNNLYFDEFILHILIDKQKRLLDELLKNNYFIDNSTRKAIELFDDGYYLLGEKTILSYKKDIFFGHNIIR